jgi:hypothetical protein
MDILTYIGIFCFGTLFGIILSLLAIQILRKYSGIIRIILNETEEKIVYSLELFDDPGNLMLKKEVRFKVDTSEEDTNRE